jgi:hypothetical protein
LYFARQSRIPVVLTVWTYNDFFAEDVACRIKSSYERALTSDVDNIECQIAQRRISRQDRISPRRRHHPRDRRSGVGLRVDPAHPAVGHLAAEYHRVQRINGAYAAAPAFERHAAGTDALRLGNSFIRMQVTTVQGAAVPLPFGGKIRQIMVQFVRARCRRRGLRRSTSSARSTRKT